MPTPSGRSSTYYSEGKLVPARHRPRRAVDGKAARGGNPEANILSGRRMMLAGRACDRRHAPARGPGQAPGAAPRRRSGCTSRASAQAGRAGEHRAGRRARSQGQRLARAGRRFLPRQAERGEAARARRATTASWRKARTCEALAAMSDWHAAAGRHGAKAGRAARTAGAPRRSGAAAARRHGRSVGAIGDGALHRFLPASHRCSPRPRTTCAASSATLTASSAPVKS